MKPRESKFLIQNGCKLMIEVYIWALSWNSPVEAQHEPQDIFPQKSIIDRYRQKPISGVLRQEINQNYWVGWAERFRPYYNTRILSVSPGDVKFVEVQSAIIKIIVLSIANHAV